MRKLFLLIQTFVLSCSLILSPFSFAQTQQPTSAPTQQPKTHPLPDNTAPEEVVRITTHLIQIDAVVVDKEGKQVTDLKPEDFRILEDGKEQAISNFSYIALQKETPKSIKQSASDTTKMSAPPLPPAKIKPEQVRRTIALIADDLGLTFEDTVYTRKALTKFVDEQMQEGDLVAIIRSSAGNGALQQFTSDKRLLHAAIDRIQWRPFGRSQIGAFAPMGGRSSLDAVRAATASSTTPHGTGLTIRVDGSMTGASADGGAFNSLHENISAVGTIGAIRYVVDGLRELPGRKSVVLMSSGLPLFPRIGGIMGNNVSIDYSSSDIFYALRNLTEMANRASVVIYTMDTRGLVTNGINAADDTQPSFDALNARSGQSAAASGVITNRKAELTKEHFYQQDGLNYLASQTGGFFFHDNNDLAGGIQKVVDDQRGYYLIGYEPDDATFNALGRRTFHKLQVQVKNPKLRVRSRTGFFGISDEEFKRPVETREQQLTAALLSPFTANNVEINLTSLVAGDHENQFVRSLIHINARDLTFTPQPNGDYLTNVDVAVTTHDVNGLSIDRGGRTYTLRVKGPEYESLMRDGFAYALDIPIKKPGAYQLRLAVRDENTKKIGSATEFIEVPDLKNNRLALSGISMSGEYEKGEKNNSLVQSSPALRHLKRGMVLNYGYAIYNPKLDPSNHTQLNTQVKLFHEGKEVFIGKESRLAEQQTSKTKRVFAGGSIDLGANLQPGEYVLQVIVNDLLAKEKNRNATQWMNFEIVN